MKILLLAYGSRGDIQPLIALAAALQDAGHTVRLTAPTLFTQLAASAGVRLSALPGDPTILMGAMTAHTGSRLQRLYSMAHHFAPIARGLIQQAYAASQGMDLIIHSLWTTSAGRLAALKRGIPDISASLFPLLSPTSAFPALPYATETLGATGNWLSHQLLGMLFWYANRYIWSLAQQADQQLPAWDWHLQPSASNPMPILHACSPLVMPRPADWGAQEQITGYWFLKPNQNWQPPAILTDFLAQDQAPVIIGFGSMVVAPALIEQMMTTLAETGLPVIWLTGWSGIIQRPLPAHMIQLPEVPHDWLFPRAAALILHGGAGTVAAALRAGVPTITMPFIADQHFWGQRIAALGVGPAPLPVIHFEPALLQEALIVANSTLVRQRAALLGAAIRAESGTMCATRIIEQIVADNMPRSASGSRKTAIYGSIQS